VRILRPGGRFIVQETNPRNPLFRLYMGYIFPLLKSIDQGTESWIEPEQWNGMEGLTILKLEYFTFLPDFLPDFLMKPLLPVQRLLEKSRFRSYSAHYMIVLEKIAEISSPEDTPVPRWP